MTSKSLITQIYLSVCILLILVSLVNPNQDSDLLIVILAVAVVLLGLPHGGLDFAVAKSLNLITDKSAALRFVAVYVAVAGLSMLFWIWLPALALVIFLAISVFHFSADWRENMPLLPRLGMAGALLCGPAIFYPSTLSTLFSSLLVPLQAASGIILLMQVGFIIGIVVLLYAVIQLSMHERFRDRWQAAEWGVLLTSSLVLTPLLHFVVYFCLLHSPRHFMDVANELNVSSRYALKISLPFVILTLVAAVGWYRWGGSGVLHTDLLRGVFISLFGLTMSHMLLVHMWHKSH